MVRRCGIERIGVILEVVNGFGVDGKLASSMDELVVFECECKEIAFVFVRHCRDDRKRFADAQFDVDLVNVRMVY